MAGVSKQPRVIETLADLTPDPRNARRHNPRNVGMLEKALGEVGAARSIVIDERGVVLAGNATIEAAARAGIEKVQVVDADGETIIAVRRTGLTAKQKTRLALYDNRTAELADWDADVIADLLATERELLDGLFADDELAELIDDLGEPETTDAEPQMDRAAELNKKWQVQAGNLWRVGEHRLLCGDSTKAADVARVMKGEMAALVMADPPYNVDYTGGSTNNRERADSYADQMTDKQYTDWLMALLTNAFAASDNKAALLLWFASAKMRCVLDAFEGAGWTQRTLIVWNKLKAHYGALGAQYKHRFEPLWYCHKLGKSPRFFGETNECTVWDVDQPRINDLHPTMKPVELYARCVNNHSARGEPVLELFGGSGTTMVACENLKRKCRGIEISPDYCAVILERMATAFPALAIERA